MQTDPGLGSKERPGDSMIRWYAIYSVSAAGSVTGIRKFYDKIVTNFSFYLEKLKKNLDKPVFDSYISANPFELY